MENSKLYKRQFEVKPLIACKPNKLSSGCTNLMYACQQGLTNSIVQELRSKPSALHKRDRNNKSTLHYCSGQTNLVAAASIAVAAPELLESADEDGFTPLHLAVIQGNISLVNLLLANNANVNLLDNEGHSVVHWATVCGELEALKAVLQAGADVSSPDSNGGSPLHYAAQMCGANYEGKSNQASTKLALEILEILLSHPNSSVEVVDSDGRQPLLWAASAGSSKAILALIKAGARIESSDRDGLTALHCAGSRGHTECIDVLVNLCGAPVDLIDLNGCTALHYAVTLGHADATALLLELGADPNRQDRKGRTPAHCGCAKGQFETVKKLALKNANVWLRNGKGDLPIHEAASSGRKELVLWFLEQRPNQINIPTNDGRTLLHIAASNENIEMCKMLIELGAEINIISNISNVSQTPLDCALQKGYRSIAKYLQANGGLPANKIRLSARHKLKKKEHVKPLMMREKEELIDVKSNVKRYVVYVEKSKSQELLCNAHTNLNDDYFQEKCKCRKYRKKRSSSCCNEVHYLGSDSNEGEMCRSKSNIEIRRQNKSHHNCSMSTSSSSLSSLSEDEHYAKKYSHISKKQIYKQPKHQLLNKRSKSTDKNHYCDAKICNGKCKKKCNIKFKKYYSDSSNDNFDEVKINVNKIEAYKKYLKHLNEEKENSTENNVIHVENPSDELASNNLNKKDIGLQAFSSRPASAQNRKPRPQSARASSAKKKIDLKTDDSLLETNENKNILTNENDDKTDSLNPHATQVITEAQIHASASTETSEIPDIIKEGIHNEGTFILDKSGENFTDSICEAQLPTLASTSETKNKVDIDIKSNEIISDKDKEESNNQNETLNESFHVLNEKDQVTFECNQNYENLKSEAEAIADTNIENVEQSATNESKSFTLIESEPDHNHSENVETKTVNIINESSSFTVLNESTADDDFKKANDATAVIGLDPEMSVDEPIESVNLATSFTVIDDKSDNDLSEELISIPSHHYSTLETTFPDENTVSNIVGNVRNGDLINNNLMIDKNSRRKKFKRKTKSRSISDDTTECDGETSLDQDQINQCSKDQDSGFEPSPRTTTKSMIFIQKPPKKIAFTALDDLDEPSFEIEKRKLGDENGVNMATVSLSMQKNIKRYNMERKIFQHLLELKSLQIRSSKSNESALVKRAVEDYHKSILSLGPDTGHFHKRYPFQEYSFKNFEIFLYETLKNLQKNGTYNFQNISEVYKEAERRLNPEYNSRNERALNCTTKTHRCLHAAHAYTGIPCAAYIPMMNHHTIPKLGFGSYKTKGVGSFYLPKILTRNSKTSNKVSLELSHGNNKQLIPLPYDKLDKNKKYYVTFSVKGNGSLNTFEDKIDECENK